MNNTADKGRYKVASQSAATITQLFVVPLQIDNLILNGGLVVLYGVLVTVCIERKTATKGLAQIYFKGRFNVMANVIQNKMAKLAELQKFSQEVENAFNTALEPLQDFVATYKVDESLEKAKKAIAKEYLYRAELAIKYAIGDNRKGQKAQTANKEDNE